MSRQLVFAALVLGAGACAAPDHVLAPEQAPVCNRVIYVSPASATLRVGQSLQVVAATCGAKSSDFQWSSSADTVAAVTADGMIRAIFPGTAVMTGTLRTIPAVKGAMALVVVR